MTFKHERERLERLVEASDSLPQKTCGRSPQTHNLKTIEPYFQAVACGRKLFELRKLDRDFQLGDILKLERYDLQRQTYLAGTITARITCILTDFPGVADGYGVLGIKVLSFENVEGAIAQ